MRYFLSLVLVSACLTACSTTGVAIPLGTNSFSATAADSVVILAEAPSRAYTDVALVDGTAATDDYFTREKTMAAALRAMKEKAAQLGAHAIIITDKNNRPYGGALFEKIQVSGKAIRYTDGP